MEIDVIPQRKLEGSGRVERLSVRVTMSITAINKEDKKDLREIWERLGEDDSAGALLELIKRMAKEKE